jgi:N-acetylglucosaminyldiphosphoundecaprenol N-acetyl-beta-D-mannosaminyltransferase
VSAQAAASTAVLDVPVHALRMDTAIQRIAAWAAQGEARRVCFVNAHSTATARHDRAHAAALRTSDMNLPDGAPVAWMLRRLGHAGQPRVSGPDVMEALLARCEREKLPVYLLGGTPETAARLRQRITARWPALLVAGTMSPPFSTPSEEELQRTATTITASGARVVFVGLGCPKQEWWMARLAPNLPAVQLGVGAAFDFLAGTQARAPAWMRASGLEWLHRLARDPVRLGPRYLRTNSAFLAGALRQLLSR